MNSGQIKAALVATAVTLLVLKFVPPVRNFALAG